MEYDKNDKQYQTYMIDGVETHENGWTVKSDGACLFVDNEHEKTPPAVGEVGMYFGRGFGYAVRGVVIGGRTYRYQTEQEMNEAQDKAAAESRRAAREAFDAGRAEFDARIAALPEPFRLRMAGFLATSDSWGPECGPYELFCCEEAMKIADALKTKEAVKGFAKESYETQRQTVPAISDGHSGNTFGTALRLAYAYLDTPELVPDFHAGLCALLGCDTAGCKAGRKPATPPSTETATV